MLPLLPLKINILLGTRPRVHGRRHPLADSPVLSLVAGRGGDQSTKYKIHENLK